MVLLIEVRVDSEVPAFLFLTLFLCFPRLICHIMLHNSEEESEYKSR